MPCRDGPDDAYFLAEAKQRLDHVTRLLCFVMGRLEATPKSPYSELIMSNADLREWWTSHKVEDMERLAREKEAEEKEATKKAALAKLTAKERKALGL